MMQYAADWPLSLVLTPAALSHYCEIFTYLLRLRRVGFALRDVWLGLKAIDKATQISNRCEPKP
jgi:hypothetical protein